MNWFNTKDQRPAAGRLIVKKWKTGAVWAGRYTGTDKDSSNDEWCYIDEVVKRPRLIPDVDCVQGKCARCTTGCWDVCGMKNPGYIIANSVSVVPSTRLTVEQAHCLRHLGQMWMSETGRDALEEWIEKETQA